MPYLSTCSNKNFKFYNFYYFFVFTVYFSAIYFSFIRVGVIMSIVMVFIIFELLKSRRIKFNNHLDIFVVSYIIYNTFSFFWFLKSGLPIDVFIMEYSNSIIPMICFYYVGKSKLTNDIFYKTTLSSIFLCIVVGFYFHLTLPDNYRNFMSILDNTGSDDTASFLLFFRSLLGVTATGSLSSICVLLSLNKVYQSKFNKGKLILILVTFSLLLTFRRSALYVSTFAIFWLNFLYLFKFNSSKMKLLLFNLFIIFMFFILLNFLNQDLTSSITDRFSSLSSAIDERKGNWMEGLSSTSDYIFGDGLGRFGHKAAAYTTDILPDGNYFRIFAELGIFGIIIFIGIILNSLFIAFRNVNNFYLEIAIIIMICLQAIGSDIFSFQLVAPIFWYAIGRCSRDSLLISKPPNLYNIN